MDRSFRSCASGGKRYDSSIAVPCDLDEIHKHLGHRIGPGQIAPLANDQQTILSAWYSRLSVIGSAPVSTVRGEGNNDFASACLDMNVFGFSQSQWNEAKEEATRALIERAKLRGMIPYSELVKHIKAIPVEAHDVRLDHLLGEISEAEAAVGHGMLSVIVVHKVGDMQPGRGFFELANKLGRDTSDVLACWIRELHKVHGYWSK